MNKKQTAQTKALTFQQVYQDPLFTDFKRATIALSLLVNMIVFVTWVVIEVS